MLFGASGQIGCACGPGTVHSAAPGPYVLGQPQQLLALLLRFALQLLTLPLQGCSPILLVLFTEQVLLDGVVVQKG